MTTLHTTQSGTLGAPSIVFLHGLGMGQWMWTDQIAAFSDYHCINVDLPGHGGSSGIEWVSFAQTADPTQGQAGQIVGVFLGLLGVTLVFAAGLHHTFLRGIAGSYELFAPGKPFSVADAADFALGGFVDAFRIGLQIAAPVVVAGLVFRLGLGVLARLAPTIQVFFVAMPLNILGGFIVLTLGLSAGMLVWLDRLQDYAQGGWR